MDPRAGIWSGIWEAYCILWNVRYDGGSDQEKYAVTTQASQEFAAAIGAIAAASGVTVAMRVARAQRAGANPDGRPSAALTVFDHANRSATDVALPGCSAADAGAVASSHLHGGVDAVGEGNGRKLLWFSAGSGAAARTLDRVRGRRLALRRRATAGGVCAGDV